jgi:hypothetical protein
MTAMYPYLTATGTGWTCDNPSTYTTDQYFELTSDCVPDRLGTPYSKHVRLDFSTADYVLFRTYDDSTPTRRYINDSFNTGYAQRVKIGVTGDCGGTLSIYLSPRWLLGYSTRTTGEKGNTNYTSFCGCVENTRDNANDLVTNPSTMNCPPIGFYAGQNKRIDLINSINNGNNTSYYMGSSYFDSLSTDVMFYEPPVVNPWNGNLFSSDLIISYPMGYPDIRGRLYGLKAATTSSREDTYLPNDTVSVLCTSDTNGGYWCNNNGSTVTHLIIPTYAYSLRFYIPAV